MKSVTAMDAVADLRRTVNGRKSEREQVRVLMEWCMMHVINNGFGVMAYSRGCGNPACNKCFVGSVHAELGPDGEPIYNLYDNTTGLAYVACPFAKVAEIVKLQTSGDGDEPPPAQKIAAILNAVHNAIPDAPDGDWDVQDSDGYTDRCPPSTN